MTTLQDRIEEASNENDQSEYPVSYEEVKEGNVEHVRFVNEEPTAQPDILVRDGEREIRVSKSFSTVQDSIFYNMNQQTEKATSEDIVDTTRDPQNFRKWFNIAVGQEVYYTFKKMKYVTGFQTDEQMMKFLLDIGAAKLNQLNLDLKASESEDLAFMAEEELEGYGILPYNQRQDTIPEYRPPRKLRAEKKQSTHASQELAVLSCVRCGKYGMTQYEYDEHQKTCDLLAKYRNPSGPIIPPNFVLCVYCSARFTNAADLKRHRHIWHKHHPDYYICPHCQRQKAYTDKCDLVRHQKSDPVCRDCYKSYEKMHSLAVHRKICQKAMAKARAHCKGITPITQKYPQCPPSLRPPLPECQSPKSTPEKLVKTCSSQGDTATIRRINEFQISDNFLTVMSMNLIPDNHHIYIPPTSYRDGYMMKRDIVDDYFPKVTKCEQRDGDED